MTEHNEHHNDRNADSNPDDHGATMGENPGAQGDFASGQDDEGQNAEQAVNHDADLEEKTDDEVGPSTDREQPTPKDGATGGAPDSAGDTSNLGGHSDSASDDDSNRDDDDAHANEPRTDAAAPPAQGPAA